MQLSDINSAKNLKIKFYTYEKPERFAVNDLIKIEKTSKEDEFWFNIYGKNVTINNQEKGLLRTDKQSANYIQEVLEEEKKQLIYSLFAVDDVMEDSIVVQIYHFQSIVECKTPLIIQVPEQYVEQKKLETWKRDYIWDGLGCPAVFCWNCKTSKKQKDGIRFLSARKYLVAQGTPLGIVVQEEKGSNQQFNIPINLYIAPEIRFVSKTDYNYFNKELEEDLEKISSSNSYLARWEAYNNLSLRIIEDEKKAFGEVTYSSYTSQSNITGSTYEFVVEDEVDTSFLGKQVGVQILESVGEEDDDIQNLNCVGTVHKISKNKIVTTTDIVEDSQWIIPERGKLKLYMVGDTWIIKRREKARDRILTGRSSISSMRSLIEVGISGNELWGDHKVITQEFKKHFKKATSLIEAQQKAIDIAINTPDIAVIQGPPGTGKTTVIRAICERFREIYEAEERKIKKVNPEYTVRSAKILISSFQNDALDNAISAPLPGDLPAYRKNSKYVKTSTQEQYQKSLDGWYEELSKTLKTAMPNEEALRFMEEKSKLSDAFFSYKNAGENVETAVQLIEYYLNIVGIEYPKDLLERANTIVKSIRKEKAEEVIEDPIIKKLNVQRLEPDSFEDDGMRNAYRLWAYIDIRSDLEISEEEKRAILSVCSEDYSQEDFQNYVKVIQTLKKKYSGDKTEIDVENNEQVSKCILELLDCYEKQFINTLSDIESRKSYIIAEFLFNLQSEYETLVQKYSSITAATCQSCLNIGKSENLSYDLVIVDEAARANPLDLLIPMSMGKKVILVGDHKQLPHMLEDDVIKLITEDPKYKDISELEKGLFERLFTMFSKGEKKKAILLTHQFRMHPEICNFVSDAFYEGQLKTSDKVPMEKWESPKEINQGKPLTYVNISKIMGTEVTGQSKSRDAEVTILCSDIKQILEIEKEASIGIITFYSEQAKKIMEKIELSLNEEEKARVEIGTVDAFQGKEFDYVLLSCVRSNYPKKVGQLPIVGFLIKPNRLCVAFSRAIKQLVVYGDAETLMQIPCFATLFELCINGGGHYREY